MREKILKGINLSGVVELSPVDGRKSFNGKCRVYPFANGKLSGVVLYSYNTPVMACVNGNMVKLWNNWTNTTGRHVNAFMVKCGKMPINKKAWEDMEVIG